ncbi:DUF6220 domain-containing protein [Pseudalkalibacillus decolorationis]|uniref:DUF6220 domain-containing protein n=1 Tax=Pseudalkalibacillus decolorationis TaxID=163879 RepID=UPI00214961EB|nr:DUF6220 domain-containing protein [Pseudalkalibacillus decolorationis]
MEKEQKSNRVRLIRGVFTILAVLLFICVTIQVFLAGIAIFVEYGQWNYHRNFIHFFEFTPLAMLILSFFGRIPKKLRWQSASIYLMIILQYITTQLGSIPYISALHPVIALLLFWTSLLMAQESIRLLKRR